MNALVETSNQEVESSASLKGESSEAEAVLQELERILASRYFRSAGRSRQFLQYVVQQKLGGHLELLKERTIGTEVFQRSPDYATGDDPVVRVQAGEVRRRLEQYYQEAPGNSPVSIKLPVGSYSPTFHWASEKTSPAPELPPVAPLVAASPVPDQQPQTGLRTRRWAIAAACFLLLASVAGVVLFKVERRGGNLSFAVGIDDQPSGDSEEPRGKASGAVVVEFGQRTTRQSWKSFGVRSLQRSNPC